MAAHELGCVLGQWSQRPVDSEIKIKDISSAFGISLTTPWLLSTLGENHQTGCFFKIKFIGVMLVNKII